MKEIDLRKNSNPIESDPLASEVRSTRRLWSYIHSIREAATKSHVNFQWLKFNNALGIMVPDFDVIYGALPAGMVVRRMLGEDFSGNVCVREESLPFIGPDTVNYYLEHIPEICLPPGTIIEMIQCKNDFSNILQIHADKFLERIERAAQADDPAAMILQDMTDSSIIDKLQQELKNISDTLGGWTLIDTLFARQRPVEDFVGQAKESESKKAFQTVLNILNVSRPNKTKNNLYDALNVAVVIKMFNSPIHKSSQQRRIPLFISQTKEINNFRDSYSWFKPSGGQERFTVFNDSTYLAVYEGLLKHNRSRLEMAADEANLIAEEAQRLGDGYEKLLKLLQKKQKFMREKYGNNFPDDDLIDLNRELLALDRSEFENRWKEILIPSIRLMESDRVQLINTLMSPDITCLLKSTDPRKLKEGIQTLIRKLRNYRHPDLELWQSVQGITMSSPKGREALMETINISIVPNDGKLLSRLEPGVKVDMSDPRSLCELKEGDRVVVHTKHPMQWSLLAIDLLIRNENPSRNHVSVVWVHQCDADRIWQEAVKSLYSCITVLGSAHHKCAYSIFSKEKKYDGEVGSQKGAAKVMRSLFDQTKRIDYFQIDLGPFSFYADVEPLDNEELQAGLSFSVHDFEKGCREVLSTMISKTSQLKFHAGYFHVIIDILIEQISQQHKK